MLNPEIKTCIGLVLDESLEGLFADLNVAVEIVDSQATNEPSDIAMSVGFISPTMRGALTVLTNRLLATKTRPRELRYVEATDLDLVDWIGELANQVLGRFKNRLLAHGIVLQLGTPSVVRGEDLRPVAIATDIWQRHLKIASSFLVVHVEAVIEPGFELVPQSAGEEQPMSEGEIALF